MKRILRPNGYNGEEREMHINYVDGDDYILADVYFPRMATKIKKCGAELVQIEYYIKGDKEVECGWKFKLSPEQLSFRQRRKEDHELTPEQLEKRRRKAEIARERIKKMHTSKSSE